MENYNVKGYKVLFISSLLEVLILNAVVVLLPLLSIRCDALQFGGVFGSEADSPRKLRQVRCACLQVAHLAHILNSILASVGGSSIAAQVLQILHGCLLLVRQLARLSFAQKRYWRLTK